MPVSDFVYDNWGNITEIDMLYDELISVYEIETSTGGVIEISEPIGWRDVTFIHKRDPDMKGFNYEMTGTDFNLKFDCDSGMDDILLEYNDLGNDGEVLFRRILKTAESGGTEVNEFEGRLNLNTLKRSDYTVECQIERKSLHQLIGSRSNTKVAIDSDEDLDQNPVPTYAGDIVALLGQKLSETFISSQTVIKEEVFTETRTGDMRAFVFFDYTEPTVSTIKQYYGNILGISGDNNALVDDRHAVIKFAADGKYTVTVSADFKVDLKINPRFISFGKKVKEAELHYQLIINNPVLSKRRVFTIAAVPLFKPNRENVSYPRVAKEKIFEDIEVEAGESLIVVATIIYRHNANKLKSVVIRVKQYSAKMTIKGTSSQEPTLAAGRLIKSTMDALFWRVTGVEGVVFSKFYSLAGEGQAVDGCGSNRILINGGAIRGAPKIKFPFTTTVKDMLMSMNAIDCIGMGYEWDPDNQREIVRIEPTEYFYQDVELMWLDSIFDYKEEVAKEMIYNKLVFGYDKYKEEEENSYDEIHAYHEYQTPIRTEANEYSQKSKYNASGYLIEETRRVQFEEKPDDSTTYDDDIFILHVYNPGGVLPLWGPVTEEPFEAVSGILDAETTSNMTLTPKRMLMAHGKWLMSSLIYKDAGQPIKNTFVKQNKEFTSTLKADYCPRGDESFLPLRADEDMLIGALRPDLDGIYSPEWVWFKARLSMNKVRLIMNALRGIDPNGKNYGYIRYTNDLGVNGKGWVYEVSYNRMTEEVSFKLLKKKFQ